MKHKKICLLLILIFILIPIITYARYFEKLENVKGKATIAEPIFIVENLSEKITSEINKESEEKEYIFKIKNYIKESENTKRISEVDMTYNIEIVNENNNFPAKYELYKINSTENLIENDNKTKEISILKKVEYEETYKLVATWQNKDSELASNDNVRIIINSSQVK